MPRTYKFLTFFLGLTGSIGLVITGEINPVMAAGGIAIIPGYYRFLKGRAAAPGWVIGICSVLTLGVFLFDSFVLGDVFVGVAHLTITFQAIKSFDLKEPWDYLQVYFVSLLQMVIASELSQSLVFGVVFIIFLVALVAAMVFSHFVKEGHEGEVVLLRPIAIISLLSLVSTAIFFVALPRRTFTFFGKSHIKGIRTSGFSDRVSFGSMGEIKLDPSVVMRIELGRSIPLPYYWRGMSLDYFDGAAWRNTMREHERLEKFDGEYILGRYDKESAVEQRIYLEPIDSDIIFGLPEIKGLKVDSFFVRADRAGALFLFRKAARRAYYSVYSNVSSSLRGAWDERYLQFPQRMERLRSLARDITSTARTDRERATLIERYIGRNYTYSLSVPPPRDGMSPVEDFIFYSKKGFCEHFATSMVLMLRAVGVPARIVNGFYGGEANKYGGYIIVRQSDAHSWVEAFINSEWIRFDPTPSVLKRNPTAIALFLDSLKMNWERYIVGFRGEDQRTILKYLSAALYSPFSFVMKTGKMKDLLYLFPLSLMLFCIVYLIRRAMGRKRYGYASQKYIDLRKAIAGAGLSMPLSVTPGDVINRVRSFQIEAEVMEFVRLYEEYRFGRRPMGAEERRRYGSLFRTIKIGLKR